MKYISLDLLNNLVDLDLKNNSISQTNNYSFNNLKKLFKLNLDSNQIQFISSNSFLNWDSLKFITLNDINIEVHFYLLTILNKD